MQGFFARDLVDETRWQKKIIFYVYFIDSTYFVHMTSKHAYPCCYPWFFVQLLITNVMHGARNMFWLNYRKKKSSFFSLFIESNDDLNDVWHFSKSDCVGNSICKKETKYFVFTSDFDFNILLFQMINDELLLTCVQVCRHHRA